MTQEQHQEVRSQLQQAQAKWIEEAETVYSEALDARKKNPSPYTERVLAIAYQGLEAQKDLVRRSSEELEVQTQMREDSAWVRGDGL